MKGIILFWVALFISLQISALNPVNAVGGSVTKITKSDFLKKVMDYEKSPKTWKYQGTLPCVIDFYADWCAPCRKAAPVMEELSKKYDGKVLFYKINTDEEKELAAVFRITGIPAFLWVPVNGQPVMKTGVAATPEAILQQFESSINEILLKK